jgi:hypothetical protein
MIVLAISTYIKAPAGTLNLLISHLTDFLADIFETGGNTFARLFQSAAARLHELPFPGKLASLLLGWLGNIAAGATNLAGALIKAVGDTFGGLAGAGIKMVLGLACAERKLLFAAAADLVLPLAGALVFVTGHTLSLLQRLFFCQRIDRELTGAEKIMLQQVFHQSLALYNIRIVEGWSGLFGLGTHRAFTLGNLVFTNKMEFSRQPAILVHECVHAWQNQHTGCRYAAAALVAQWYYRKEKGGAYDWRAELSRGKSRWLEFNPEAAAELVEDLWRDGLLRDDGSASSNTAPRNDSDQSPIAIEAIRTIRSFRNFRLSGRMH